jgi:hypothetical protein
LSTSQNESQQGYPGNIENTEVLVDPEINLVVDISSVRAIEPPPTRVVKGP